MGRIVAQAGFERSDGGVEMSGRQVRVAEQKVSFRIRWLEHERHFESLDGFFSATRVIEHGAKAPAKSRHRRVKRNRAHDQINARGMITDRISEQSQQMQSIGMPGIVLQHGAISCFGLSQAARPVMFDRFIEFSIEAHHGCLHHACQSER
jgi:hypothetical protein